MARKTSLVKKFENGLDDLFLQYTQKLRHDIGRRATGRNFSNSKAAIRKKIETLVDITRQIELKRVGKKTFRKAYAIRRQWHVKKGKGHGIPEKSRNFRYWYEDHVQATNCVYVFWKARQCIYVGRTGTGGSRPERHFEKYWFSRITRVDIYEISQSRKLPMSECLAIDIFDPKENKVRASRKSYATKCPVCSKGARVRKELKKLFALKRARRN